MWAITEETEARVFFSCASHDRFSIVLERQLRVSYPCECDFMALLSTTYLLIDHFSDIGSSNVLCSVQCDTCSSDLPLVPIRGTVHWTWLLQLVERIEQPSIEHASDRRDLLPQPA